MLRTTLLGLFLATAIVACGSASSSNDSNSVDDSDGGNGPSSKDPSNGNDPSDCKTTTSSEAAVETGTKDRSAAPTSGGSATESFHRGCDSMQVDHQRSTFAILTYTHAQNREQNWGACYDVCGNIVDYDACGKRVGASLAANDVGVLLDLPSESYPTSDGGTIAVKKILATRVAGDLVLHVTTKNGTEFDDTWQSGHGDDSECSAAVCHPTAPSSCPAP